LELLNAYNGERRLKKWE